MWEQSTCLIQQFVICAKSHFLFSYFTAQNIAFIRNKISKIIQIAYHETITGPSVKCLSNEIGQTIQEKPKCMKDFHLKKTYIRQHLKSCFGRKLQYTIFSRVSAQGSHSQPLAKQQPANKPMHTHTHKTSHILSGSTNKRSTPTFTGSVLNQTLIFIERPPESLYMKICNSQNNTTTIISRTAVLLHLECDLHISLNV